MSWIIVGLDGTICDVSHRIHLAQAKEWEAYEAGIPGDHVRRDVSFILGCFLPFAPVNCLLITGRNERNRKATEAWLSNNGISPLVDHLIMRPNDDRSPEHEFKLAAAIEFFGSEERMRGSVICAIDDRDKVVEAWRNAGIACWQVQAGGS